MPSNLEKKQKYSKKTNFSREKQYAYSEEDITKIDNKQNEWNEKRKEERHHNIKVASGDINETEKPVKAEKQKNGNYADDIIEYDSPTFSPKMTLVMHGIPLSYNMDNVMRTFQYYGDVKCLNISSNIDSTYTVTVVPNEWNENIAEIQAEIENEGFAIVADYKVTKAE